MASNPKMEYQVFLCIFQKNSAMATLGLRVDAMPLSLKNLLSVLKRYRLRQIIIFVKRKIEITTAALLLQS